MTEPERDDERLRDAFVASDGETERTEACPGDEEIWAASCGELPPERTKQLLAHSQDCAACAKSFTVAAGIAVEARIESTVRPFRQRRRPIVYVGAVAAAVVIAIALSILMRTGPASPAIPSLGESVQATLWRVGAAEDEPLSGDETLEVGDRLYLELESDVPVHLYVVNMDGAGDASALFPIEGAQWSNPLKPGSHRIPGETTWEYDSWEVSSAGGQETFQWIASRRPLPQLESALQLLDQASPGEFIRGADDPPAPGGADAVAAALRDLTSSMSAEDLVVREIVLDNPE